MSDPLPPNSPPSLAEASSGADDDSLQEVEADLRSLLAPAFAAESESEVPVGFSDRVLETLQRQGEDSNANAKPPATSWTSTAQTAAFGALAAGLSIFFFQSLTQATPPPSPIELARHQSVRVADRGTAVGERSAMLSWDVQADGTTVVEQDSGRVFYRVDKTSTTSPKPFVVRTPFGDAHVRGTCFAVEVEPMTTTQQLSLWNKGKLAAAGAAAGALLTGAVLVTVYEGRVDVKSPASDNAVVLRPGETALFGADRAPVKVAPTIASLQQERAFLEGQRKDLRAQVEQLEDQLKVVMIAKANGQDPVVAENNALKEELDSVRSRLSAYEKDESDRQGAPLEWPEDIDPVFQEDHVKESVLKSLRDLGMNGDLDSVDCSEFPCIAFGEIKIQGDREASAREMKKFNDALKSHFPEKDVSRSNSMWNRSSKGEDGEPIQVNNFGYSFYPDGVVKDDAEKSALGKRMRFRMQAYTDSLVQ